MTKISRTHHVARINNKQVVKRNPPSKPQESWQVVAKRELEKKLKTKVKVRSYDYYDRLGAVAFETIDGKEASNGEREWIVFENEDMAEKAAIAKVQEDIDNEPGLFEPNWMESHVDIENLKNQLHDDISSSNASYYDDIEDEKDDNWQNRLISELIDLNLLDEDDFKDGNGKLKNLTPALDAKVEEAKEKAIENKTDEDLEDPIEYLNGIYSKDEAMKKAIEIGGIDDDAAEDAVSTDGVAHFLDGYDGREEELPSGAVAYGTN